MDTKEEQTQTSLQHTASFFTNRKLAQKHGLERTILGLCILFIAGMISACSAATSTANPGSNAPATIMPQPTATSVPVVLPSATSLPQPIATANPTAKPPAAAAPQQNLANTLLDPCNLINAQEASTLAGTTFGQGQDQTTPEGLKTCTYSSQSMNEFTVDVIQAPDVATAQQAKAQFLSDLQANLQQYSDQGINVTQVPNFADGAVIAQVSINTTGISVNGSAMGFLKGTIFVGFSDIAVGSSAPTNDALQAEANTVLGRLP
jgi:hypothetical protein